MRTMHSSHYSHCSYYSYYSQPRSSPQPPFDIIITVAVTRKADDGHCY